MLLCDHMLVESVISIISQLPRVFVCLLNQYILELPVKQMLSLLSVSVSLSGCSCDGAFVYRSSSFIRTGLFSPTSAMSYSQESTWCECVRFQFTKCVMQLCMAVFLVFPVPGVELL